MSVVDIFVEVIVLFIEFEVKDGEVNIFEELDDIMISEDWEKEMISWVELENIIVEENGGFGRWYIIS